jgi:rod shape-determining protein MreD
MTAARVAAVVFLTILVQVSFVARFPVFAARGDVVVLLAVVAGIEGNAERGAVVGFASGLVLDLLLDSPVGLSALTYCLVGFLVGTFHTSVLRSAWWIPVVTTVLASVIGVLAFAVLDEVVGSASVEPGRLPAIVAVVALLNGVLSHPARWVMRLAFAVPASEPNRDRFSIR